MNKNNLMFKVLRISLLSLLFILSAILFVFSLIDVKEFNSNKHLNNYSCNEISVQNNPSSCLYLSSFNKEKEAWVGSTTKIEEDSDISYRADQFTFDIKNGSSTTIAAYKFKVTFTEKVYLLTMWTGTLEIHQFYDGLDHVYSISKEMFDNQSFINDDDFISSGIKTMPQGGNNLILFNVGDYFIYTPGYSGWESPLLPNNDVYPGMICFHNSENESITLNTDFVYPKEEAIIKDDVKFVLTSRNEYYGKAIYDDETSTAPNYIMNTYDIDIYNYTEYLVKEYTYRIDFTDTVYLKSMWTGSIEIHQNVLSGNEIVEKLDDGRELGIKLSSGETNLKYVKTGNDSSSDYLVLLQKGDFIIYYPKAKENNIDKGNNDNSGFIVCYLNGSEKPMFDVTINYFQYKEITNEVTFFVSLGLFIGFFVLFIIDIIYKIQIHKYELERKHDEKMIVESIETFTSFIDAKDEYTNGHSKRVAYYAKMIAQTMGMKDDEVTRVYYIALMHDCGKIGIPDNILTKPSKLTKEEFEIIKSHTTKGYEILKDFTSIEGIRDGVLYHHERYDGNGYPKRLKGEEIPLIARIICVADSFDAMTSNRCYRNKLDKEKVMNELINNKGTQFDPKIVDIFISLINEGKIKL